MKNNLSTAQQNFVDKLLNSFNDNKIPWRSTWDRTITKAYNATSNQEYKGTNQLNLFITSLNAGYDDPRWMTFKQANAQGYKIKKGSMGTDIFHYALKNDETGEIVSRVDYQKLNDEQKKQIRLVSKSYKVFNAQQIDGIPALDIQTKAIKFENEKAAAFANTLQKNMNVEIIHKGNKAYYSPTEDNIVLPDQNKFMDEQSYYATRLHETAHATASKERLNRSISTNFGSKEYAIEELRAELTSAFLTMDIGFHFDDFHEANHQAYIQSWKEVITDDPGVIFSAINDALKIKEYILDKGEYEKIYTQEIKKATLSEDGYLPGNLDNVFKMSWEEYPYESAHLLEEKESVIMHMLGIPIIVQCGFLDSNGNYYTNIQWKKIARNMDVGEFSDWFHKTGCEIAGHKISNMEDLMVLKDYHAHGYIDTSFISFDQMEAFIRNFEYLTNSRYEFLNEDTCNRIQEEMVLNAPLTIKKMIHFKNKYLTEELLKEMSLTEGFRWEAKARGNLDPLDYLHKVISLETEELSEKNDNVKTELNVMNMEVPNSNEQQQAKQRKTIVINLFGGPGAGKTTCAWEIASELKKLGYVTEYVPEYAKDLVWDNRMDLLDGSIDHQKEILDEQSRRINRLVGKVDFIVTDAPSLLNLNYLKETDQAVVDEYKKEVFMRFKEHENFNLIINRGDHYETEGRIHTKNEAIYLDKTIKNILDENHLYYGIYDHKGVDQVIHNCIKTYDRINHQSDLANKKTIQEISLDDMKNSISIADYARDVLGMGLVKESRGLFRLEEHDSCKIYPNNTFYRFSRDVGGSIIDFIKHFEECDTKEAISKMKKYYMENHPSIQFDSQTGKVRSSYNDSKGLIVPEKADTMKHVYAYLTKTRGIKPGIVNEYINRKILYEDINHNCVFVGKVDNTIYYANIRGTSKKAFKMDAQGSIKEVGVYVDNKADTLILNEAVIDQMSYMSMTPEPNEYNYLSVCGASNAVSALRFHMEKRKKESQDLKRVIVGLDNDAAGEENAMKVIDYLKENYPDIESLVHVPTAKDFNEQLIQEMDILSSVAPSQNQDLAMIAN